MSILLIVFGAALLFVATAPLVWRLMKTAAGRKRVPMVQTNHPPVEVQSAAPLKRLEKPF